MLSRLRLVLSDPSHGPQADPAATQYVLDAYRATFEPLRSLMGKRTCLEYGHYYDDSTERCLLCPYGSHETVFTDASGRRTGAGCS